MPSVTERQCDLGAARARDLCWVFGPCFLPPPGLPLSLLATLPGLSPMEPSSSSQLRRLAHRCLSYKAWLRPHGGRQKVALMGPHPPEGQGTGASPRPIHHGTVQSGPSPDRNFVNNAGQIGLKDFRWETVYCLNRTVSGRFCCSLECQLLVNATLCSGQVCCVNWWGGS